MKVVPSSTTAAMPQINASPARSVPPENEEGMTFDPNFQAGLVSVGMTDEERAAFDYRKDVFHRVNPMHQAGSALETIQTELGKLQEAIAAARPDLADASWDVTIEDGKLKVVGEGLAEDDAHWLSEQLNGNGRLTAAVSTFVDATVAYLQTSDENPAYGGVNYYSGSVQSYEFNGVKGQLEGKLQFKELIGTVSDMWNSPNQTSKTTGYDVGYSSMEVLASRLSSGSSNG